MWADDRPSDHDKGIVFPGVQRTTWTFDDAAGMWYFHRFYDHQPDLNTENPAVRDEIMKIMGYWLELGASGFRMDAVPFLIEKKLTTHNFSNRPKSFAVDPRVDGGNLLVDVFDENHSRTENGTHELKLPAYGHRWMRIGAIDNTLNRRPF